MLTLNPLPCALDTAYIEAQIVGKTRALCIEGSRFLQSYAVCKSCIGDNTLDDAKAVASDFLDQNFSQFIGYCKDESYDQETATPTATSRDTTLTSFVVNPETKTGAPTIDQEITIITTIWGTTTLSDGLVISLPVTATIVGLDRGWFGGRLENTAAPTGSSDSPLSVLSDDESRPSTGTIAGAVIGGVCGITLMIVLLLVFLRRRTKEKHATTEQELRAENEKPQLHGDSMAEMSTESNTAEIDGDENKGLSRYGRWETGPVYELETPPAMLYGSEVTSGAIPGEIRSPAGAHRDWPSEKGG